MLAVQYLGDEPGVAAIAPDAARARLQAAFERLPISCVLLGWNLPDALRQACGEETARAGAQLLRWHLLLSGDATFVPRPEWRVIGLTGDPVPGFRNQPEFTFLCPNRPAVREAALNHLRDAIQHSGYQGVFLDRIRYPSPAADPSHLLACFCDDCHRVAAEEGFDLEVVRQRIRALLATPERLQSFVWVLLDPQAPVLSDPDLAALRTFLDFRVRSVTRFIQTVADAIHAEGLAVGLDCFSPALTYVVGQDIKALNPCCEWIKVMTYGHTHGPAGLPFELLALADWLVSQKTMSETEALEWLSMAAHVLLPPTRVALSEEGLTPEALGIEIRRARTAGARTLLAGIELVELEGVTRLHQTQIAADLRAFRAAQADGLVLSWDLWHIPVERLDLVRLHFGP